MQPSLTEFLLSSQGRVSRSQFWLKWALPYAIVTIVVTMALHALLEPTAAAGVAGIYYLLGVWPSFAIYIKRAHDRGRSGWFVLLLFVPVLNIWAIIELLFLAGTTGPNTYGADQLRMAA